MKLIYSRGKLYAVLIKTFLLQKLAEQINLNSESVGLIAKNT